MTTVYTFYANDTCLYVGITNDFAERAASHVRREWFREVTRAEFEHYATRTEARVREYALIQQKHPRHNVQHNRTPRVRRAASIPGDIVTRALEEAQRQGHNSFSQVCNDALIEYLARRGRSPMVVPALIPASTSPFGDPSRSLIDFSLVETQALLDAYPEIEVA